MTDRGNPIDPWDIVFSNPELASRTKAYQEAEKIRMRHFRDVLEASGNSSGVVEIAVELDNLKDRSNTADRKFLDIRYVTARNNHITLGVPNFGDPVLQENYHSMFSHLIKPNLEITFIPEQLPTPSGLRDGDGGVLLEI